MFELYYYRIERHLPKVRYPCCPGLNCTIIGLKSIEKHGWSSEHFFGDDEIIPTNGIPKTIKSVHLLGAAVNREQIFTYPSYCLINESSLECSGKAIETQVQDFYNYYNTEDNMISPIIIWSTKFKSVYEKTENNIALGSSEIEITPNVPDNFHQTDVTLEIPSYKDANNDNVCDIRYYYAGTVYCTIYWYGDNHQGYMGFRDSDNSLRNNGAIDEVVSTWNFS